MALRAAATALPALPDYLAQQARKALWVLEGRLVHKAPKVLEAPKASQVRWVLLGRPGPKGLEAPKVFKV